MVVVESVARVYAHHLHPTDLKPTLAEQRRADEISILKDACARVMIWCVGGAPIALSMNHSPYVLYTASMGVSAD